jgi:hypothetical protein
MSLELGLSSEHLEVLRSAIENNSEYKTTQEKMRAAVLLCAQELINSTQPSAFEQFHCDLPDIPNVKLALAAVIEFLRLKGLDHTVSVLLDETKVEEVGEGGEELTNLLEKVPEGPNPIARIIAASK